MPVAEDDPCGRGPVYVETMDSRPVGMAVDQRLHARGAQQGLDRGLVDVGDIGAGAGQMLAGCRILAPK